MRRTMTLDDLEIPNLIGLDVMQLRAIYENGYHAIKHQLDKDPTNKELKRAANEAFQTWIHLNNS